MELRPAHRHHAARTAPAHGAARALGPVLLVGLALLVYRPWIAAPFSTLDFGEFLPLLRAHGPVGGFLAVVRYFTGHGRSTWLTYGFISFNWLVVGDWAHGWDLLRFVLMLGVVALAYRLMRRLGCSRTGATAGAALLVVASPAQGAWTRMTGEPLGLAALLGASLLALDYRAARRWLPRAAAIALLVAAAVMAKEVLAVGALPVVVLAACWRPGRGLRPPRLDRRTVAVVGLVSAAVAATAVIVLATLAQVEAGGYAQLYGRAAPTTFRYGLYLRFMGLPLTRTSPDAVRMVAALLGSVAALGWALLLHRARTRDARLLSLLLLLLVPAMGAAVFLPWPAMERFYAFPFSAGPAVLLAVGVTALLRRSRPVWVIAPVAAALALCAAEATAFANEARAVRLVNGDLARELARMPAGDTVFVAVRHVEAHAWMGPGATLQRYLTGVRRMPAHAAPVLVDLHCARAAERLRQSPRRVGVIAYNQDCRQLPAPARVVSRTHEAVDLLLLSRVESPYLVRIWPPTTAAAAP